MIDVFTASGDNENLFTPPDTENDRDLTEKQIFKTFRKIYT